MAKSLEDIVSNLFENPGALKLKFIDRILSFKIPFNSSHKFQIKEVLPLKVRTFAPMKRSNLNHLNTMHACTIATLGEYSAGILIIKNFGVSKYRVILAKLEVEYLYQGKTNLIGEVEVTKDQKEHVFEELERKGLAKIVFATRILDEKKNHVANVTTSWQLKKWEQVKTK